MVLDRDGDYITDWFAANNMKMLFDMHDNAECMVQLRQEAKCNNGRYEALGLSAVDDLMHYCTQPLAKCNSASSCPQLLRVIVRLYYNKRALGPWITHLSPGSREDIFKKSIFSYSSNILSNIAVKLF